MCRAGSPSTLPRNALLIGEQCPDAVRVGGYKEWHSQGIEILEDEKRLPIIILEPGKAYRREDGSVGPELLRQGSL